MRQNEKRRLRNSAHKEAIRRVMRQIRKHMDAGQKEQAQALLPQLAKAADKAAARGTIHMNKAARLKSRFMKLIRV